MNTDDDPELVKEKQNITELIEKVEELDRHFEEIEWQEIMRRNRRAWYSMELDIVLTRDPQEIAKEIDHDLFNSVNDPSDSEKEEDHAEEKVESDNSEIVWEEFYDKIGYKYWKNKITEETTYEDPAKRPPSPWVRHDLNSIDEENAWIECFDEYHQSKYWYNQETGETYYDESYPEQYIGNVWEAAKMASSEGADNSEGVDGSYRDMQYNNMNGYQDNADGDYDANSTFELTEENLQEYNEYNENSKAEE